VRRSNTGESVRTQAQMGPGKGDATQFGQAGPEVSGIDEGRSAPVPPVIIMTLVSFIALAGGAVIAWLTLIEHA
jgi:hypothetical protein